MLSTVGPGKRRAPNLTRTGVQTLEHRPHLLGAGLAFQADCGGSAAHISAW
jgi:hypothetical protein